MTVATGEPALPPVEAQAGTSGSAAVSITAFERDTAALPSPPQQRAAPTLLATPTLSESSALPALRWLHEPVVEQYRPMQRWRSDLRYGLSPTVVLLALSPVLVLIGARLVGLSDSWLTLYGVGVLTSTLLVMYLSFAWYEDKSRQVELPDNPPLVSMLLAVKDDREVIERCLRSILMSDYPRLELLVVDDLSVDGTREMLVEFAEELDFRLLLNDTNVGKKRSLVAAAGQARGDIFVFTDSDCIVSPYAVSQCVKALLADARIGAVSGHGRALNAESTFLTRLQDIWYDGQFGVAKAAESVFGTVTCVSGPMAAFRREVVYNYLPSWAEDRFLGREFKFATDRQLTGYALGQKYVGHKLKARFPDSPFVIGEDYEPRLWRVEYVASARVLTNVPATARTMLKQQARWKKSFIRNFFFTGSFMWRRGSVPAFLYYGHVLWVVAAPVLAFRHLVWFPLHGGLFLTAVYLSGVAFKGGMWAVAFKLQNRDSAAWPYRILMSLISATCLSWVLPYSALTLRKSVWSRG